MGREFIIFDVASDMAHFRRQYAITTALTYPIPPRTALCGLIGAILGLPKNESLTHFQDQDAIFGLQIMSPVRTSSVSINLIDTKDNRSFRPKLLNPHTTMRYEVMRHPQYRVMFSHPSLARKLAVTLGNEESVYTPCLGLAWMIAWLEGKGHVAEAEEVRGGQAAISLVSPVRSDDVEGEIRWNRDGVYQRVRMPAVMQPDRQVTRYESYVIDTTGRPIEATLKRYWRFSDGTCFSAM